MNLSQEVSSLNETVCRADGVSMLLSPNRIEPRGLAGPNERVYVQITHSVEYCIKRVM